MPDDGELRPESPNSSDSGLLSGPGGEPDAAAAPPQHDKPLEHDKPPQHDKQGLELARSIAGRLKGMQPGPARPARRTKRRRSTDPNASGARPDDRDPQPLTSAIGRLMRDQGWEVDVAVHGVMARWPSIVGAEMAQHCIPESYTDTELLVRTDSTAWATQVRLLAPELVRRLNAVLGDGTVTTVSVQGPNAPSWRKGPRTVRGGRGPRDTYG